MDKRHLIEQAIAAQEMLRAAYGSDIVDAAVAVLREKLAELDRASAKQPNEQKRKQATVLFADISGFTALSETLDAEDVTNIINALWATVDAAILNKGGKIDKHIGDAIMALWGAETAREDDAEMAIRAALDMQDRLAAFRAQHGVDLKMRIGVNTGPILFGEVGSTGEITAMGDTVNLASRLEHAAPLNGILTSHNTYRHVRGLFDVTALEPISVKGKREPVRVYTVHGAKPRAFRVATRGVQGIETRMIGRADELATLKDALLTVTDESKLQVITVVAEAGVGKSRLTYEFINWMQLQAQNHTFLRGRATPSTRMLPYALLRDAFGAFLHINENDDSSALQEKLEKGLVPSLRGAEGDPIQRAHFIGHLIGFHLPDSPHLKSALSDVQKFRDTALYYLAQFFKALADQQPIVFILDDIHWADQRTLDVIEFLNREITDSRLLVLCLSRPELLDQREGWGIDAPCCRVLRIAPLSDDESHQMVGEILRLVDDIPADLQHLIVSRAEGNPLYVEELIKKLIDDGAILQGEESWQIRTERLAAIDVPPTLAGILQSRLDALADSERRTLQRASVIGRIFWDRALESLRTDDEAATSDVGGMLKRLHSAEFIFPQDRSSFAETSQYIFKHALLHDVAYESVLLRKRRVYHAQAAEWLISQSGERVNEYAGFIAQHFQSAQQMDRAAEYLIRAGDWAASLAANQDASQLYERALALTAPNAASTRALVCCKLGGVLVHLGEYAQAAIRFSEVLALVTEDQCPQQIAQALGGLGQIAQKQGHYTQASDYIQQSLAIARRLDDKMLMAEMHNVLGHLAQEQGDYDSAEVHYMESLNTYQAAAFASGIARAQINSFLTAFSTGKAEVAEQRITDGLGSARQAADRRLEALALSYLGVSAASQDRFAEARTHMEESLKIQREIGDRESAAFVLNNLGALSEDMHDFAKAQQYYEESLALNRKLGTQRGAAIALLNLGTVALKLNNAADAQNRYREALQLAREIGALPEALASVSGLAQVALVQGNPSEAARLAGFVMNHPQLDQQTQEETSTLLERIGEQLPANVLASALNEDKETHLNRLFSEIQSLRAVS